MNHWSKARDNYMELGHKHASKFYVKYFYILTMITTAMMQKF
jgi:hypothetical protein